jgi:hypothetical protein
MKARRTKGMDAISRQTPRSVREIRGPNEARWMTAMKDEFDNMLKNNAYNLVSEESILRERGRIGENYMEEDGTKVYFIDGVWSYRIKTKNRIITKFKARLCANRRYMQCPEDDTWSPTGCPQ